jgi:hypothetical protein
VRRAVSTTVKTSWFVIVLSGVLAGVAVVLGVVGLTGYDLALLPAVVLGGASYLLWRLGRDRMIASIYADIDAGRRVADEEGGDGGDAEPEDWHREGYSYAHVDPEDWEDGHSEEYVDPESSFFDEEFWRERERARERRKRRRDAGPGGRHGGESGRQGRERAGYGRESAGHGRESAGHGRESGGHGRDAGGAQTVDRKTAEACEVLGVEPDVDQRELKRAYRRRVKETHPDLGGDEDAFCRVQRAYEHLRE